MRVKLKTYATAFEANLAANRLLEAGLPIIVMQSTPPALPWVSPNGASELWIEDSRLLEDPETCTRIELLLLDAPLKDEDDDFIARLPVQTGEPDQEGFRLAGLAIIVAAVVIAVTCLLRVPWTW